MNFLDKCTKYNFPNFGYTRLPKPPITVKDREKYGSDEKESNSKFLSRLCYHGFEDRLKSGKIPKEKYQEYIDRVKLELDTFDSLGFTDYMLLVWKVVNKAKDIGIFMDFGRGSVSSSLVATLIGICNCDAIRYGLFFSRFLSKVRAKSKIINGEIWVSIDLAPDIDINLGSGRDDIVGWLKQTYPDRISKICNLNTLTGKIVIKDVYKILKNASEEESKEVSDLVERRFGFVQDIGEIYKGKRDENGKVEVEINEEFKEWADKNKEVYEIALKLQYLPFAVGCHASGYLISFEELENHTPLVLNKEREIMSGYTMGDVQSLKLDLLSLDTNRIIRNILDKLPINIDELNLEDDPFIYNQLQSDYLLPYGLYQLSGDCAYRVCKHVKPKNIRGLSDINAIARPTALAYEKPYLEGKEDCPEIFRDALKFSNFQPLYQENLIAMVKAIGFDEESSEQFRRTFSKKKHDEIEGWIVKIKDKLKQNNIDEKAGEYLIRISKECANYQFNLAHSVSTSLLSSLTVYLKYKYPVEFYWACLNEVKEKPNSQDLIHEISNEMKSFNIKLLSPHIIKSQETFTIENGNVRFGLNSIKGIAEKGLIKLRNFCHEYSNKFEIFSSAEQAGIGINILNSLIYAGTMDDYLTQSRSQTALEAALYRILTPREKQRALQLGEQFKYNLIEIVKYLSKIHNEDDKPFIKESRLETIRTHFRPYKQIYDQNVKNEELANYISEMELLGYSYSHRLIDILRKNYPDITDISEAKSEVNDAYITIGGQIKEVRYATSKNSKKTKYCKILLNDGSGSMNIMLFNDKIAQNEEMNQNKKYEIDQILIARGKKKDEVIFSDKAVNQNIKVCLKIGDFKEKV